MQTSEFTYELDPAFIARRPLPRRSDARLLVLRRSSGQMEHRQFSDLGAYLAPGDLVVLNDTRVFPARLEGRKETGGKVEVLLLRKRGRDWEALLHPSRRVRQGSRLSFGANGFQAVVSDAPRAGAGLRQLEFSRAGNFWKKLERLGMTPLPPYLKRRPESQDRERYQTVFAKTYGACAAPTAGLHFTKSQLSDLRRAGIHIATVTLHVGYGTFKPVTAEHVEAHRIHEEYFEVRARAAREMAQARRVVACGTTVLRALETTAGRAGRGWTGLFIYPPYTFHVVDALITNFHLPRSTLLMLVCAFAGREKILRAYEEAKRLGYRFYSYGDAMLIL